MILYGGFVKCGASRTTSTFNHYVTRLRHRLDRASACIAAARPGTRFWTTLEIAAISAPLTAAIGLLTAYLLVRQHFAGKDAFEFATMLSFAIPGTVIGVSYIIAFNVPPIELTGTGLILISASSSATCRSACAPASPPCRRSTRAWTKPR